MGVGGFFKSIGRAVSSDGGLAVIRSVVPIAGVGAAVEAIRAVRARNVPQKDRIEMLAGGLVAAIEEFSGVNIPDEEAAAILDGVIRRTAAAKAIEAKLGRGLKLSEMNTLIELVLSQEKQEETQTPK